MGPVRLEVPGYIRPEASHMMGFGLSRGCEVEYLKYADIQAGI